jgi:hypothetical protein
MTDDTTVRSYLCPFPDDYEFTVGSTAELAKHVNTEHVGEFPAKTGQEPLQAGP